MDLFDDDPFGFDFESSTTPTYPPFPSLAYFVSEGIIQKFEPVGSRVTCNPPPTDTDEDFLVFAPFYGRFIATVMNTYGFEMGGSEIVDHDLIEPSQNSDFGFCSLKLGDMNLIVTSNPKFYDRFLAASSVAKRLNVLNKADRIALFDAVIHGKVCLPAPHGLGENA